MKWRYTLIDRDDNHHIIDEPVGWDACEIEIKREMEKHGVVFDYQGNDFLFYGLANRLIRAEYDNYGSEGIMKLRIEETCEDEFAELYTGKLLFAHYDKVSSSECYSKIPIETTSDVIEFNNKFDQKVDLQTALAFDGTTALPAYSKLPFVLELPSKAVLLHDKAVLEVPQKTILNLNDAVGVNPDGPSTWPTNSWGWFQIVPQIEVINLSEIGRFATAPQPEINFICSGSYSDDHCPDLFKVRNGNVAGMTDRTLYFEWDNCTAMLVNENDDNNFNVVNSIDVNISYSLNFDVKYGRIMYLNKTIVIRRKNGTYEVLRNIQEVSAVLTNPTTNSWAAGTYWDYNTSSHVVNESVTLTMNLEDGDYFFVFLSGLCQFTHASLTAIYDAFEVTGLSGSALFESLSYAKNTFSKTFFVNEALSRTVEAITNNKIKAYSEYFGRTDSQPYSHLADGCGSLEAITKGLFIRNQENRIAGQPFAMNVSLQDLWQGLEPIHHIGFGIEEDTNRPGYNRLRVEPWKYFYKPDVVLSCIGVDKIEKKVVATEIYSTLRIGYEKWEAEEYNGLDEFLTKRLFRTTLSQIKNELVKLSKFISSGYAIEIGRRKGNTDSKDWRYDNENFIICLKKLDTPPYSNTWTDVYFQNITFGATVFHYITFDAATTIPYQIGDVIVVTGTSLNNATYTVTGLATHPVLGSPAVLVASTLVTEGPTNASIATTPPAAYKYVVELGNISTPTNIVDPDSIYNYRISPIRIAMRWVDKLFSGYKPGNINKQIIFMDGEGNYHAKGLMQSTSCRWENISLAENDTIDESVFADILKATPLLESERVEFEFPMSTADFKTLKSNPYGTIHYSNESEEGYGWIDTIKYKPEEGLATFSLIPKK